MYMTAAELYSLGEEALEIYNTFDIAKEAPEVAVDTILEAFRNYCTPKKNVVFERHQFWICIMQEPMQSYKFVTELWQKKKKLWIWSVRR